MRSFLPGKLGESSTPRSLKNRDKDTTTSAPSPSAGPSGSGVGHKRIVVPLQLPDPRYSTLPDRTPYPIMASAYSDHYYFVEQHFNFSQFKLPVGEGRIKARVRELLTDQEKMFLVRHRHRARGAVKLRTVERYDLQVSSSRCRSVMDQG